MAGLVQRQTRAEHEAGSGQDATSGIAQVAAAPPEPMQLPQGVVDDIVEATIEQELARYQQIPLTVPAATAADGAAAAPEISVPVSAAYFINTQTAQQHFETPRAQAHFDQVVRRVRSPRSEIRSTRGQEMSAGRMVQMGKATPDDVGLFLQTAINAGEIDRCAIQQGMLPADGRLGSLDAGQITEAIESWAEFNGVGVDCSGFVVYDGRVVRGLDHDHSGSDRQHVADRESARSSSA